MGQRGLVVKLFFDDENGYLVWVRMTPSPIGRVPIMIDYSDYREVDGIRLPHTWTFAWLDGRTTMNLKEIRLQPEDRPGGVRPARGAEVSTQREYDVIQRAGSCAERAPPGSCYLSQWARFLV